MNYKKIYDQIIYRAKNRIVEGYKEKHHIIPKCIGGCNDKDNIVELTAREHFLCHWLLHEIYPDNPSLFYAFSMMSIIPTEKGNRYKPSSRVYEYCKNKMREKVVSYETKLKISISHKGKILSEDHKKKLSKAKIGKPGPNTGKIFSESHRLNISNSRIGEKNWRFGKKHSKNTISKMRKPKSEEAKIKMSESAKDRKKVECPYCKKIGQYNAMQRWHFHHCKDRFD
jgi:hypothetical protein